MDHGQEVSPLLITGTMGDGKSAVMAEASDLLDIRQAQHAAVDVDMLGMACLTSVPNNVESECR